MSWFDILYSVKKSYADYDDFTNVANIATTLDGKSDESRVGDLKSFLAQYHILRPSIVNIMQDAIYYNTELAEAVRQTHEAIQKITLDNDKSAAYGEILARIIESNGRFINSERRDISMEVKELDDDSVFRFIDSFNKLKTTQDKNLMSIIDFIVNNGLQKVSLMNINGSKPNVDNNVEMLPYVLQFVQDVKSFNNTFKTAVYNVLIGDIRNDDEFLDEFNAVNKNLYKFDAVKVEEKLEIINRAFPNQDVIIGNLKKVLDSTEFMNSQQNNADIKALIDLFGKKKITKYSIKTAIEHLIAFQNGDKSIKPNIVTPSVEADVIGHLDKVIQMVLDGCVTIVNGICDDLEKYNALLNSDILVGKVEVKLNDCISRWNDFFKSTLYTQHAKDVITSMTHIADVTLKSFKQPNTFKVITNDTVKNIVDLIKNIDVNSEAHKFGNISNYVNQNLPRESVRQRLAIEMRVLQFLKELFLHPYAPFSEFPTFSASVDDTYYYSVCCNLIYFKDSSIKESLIYESYLYVGGYLITEGKSLVDYFNKLQDKIGELIQKKELVNWGDYVKKAIFKGEINNKSDGENSQTISDEELEKCAADVVASTVGAAAVAKKS